MTSPAPRRSFTKDLQQLYRTIDASTDGQASIAGMDEMKVQVSLRPKSGCNAHAEFLVTIKCCTTYPRTCPDVFFNTPIFHPNIDPSSGSVCLSILDEWRSCYSLLDLVKALLYLINHPNFESPFGALEIRVESAQLARNSARLLAGLPVNGLRYPPNAAWVEWARVSGCLPSEEEEELGEAEVKASVNAEFDQEDNEGINQSLDAWTSEDEVSTVATVYASSDTTSGTVPSFAKIRYSFDSDEGNSSYGPYVEHWSPLHVESQRILIWPPSNDNKCNAFTVFFFVEFLGSNFHRSDLGLNYNTLFTGSVIHECQSHPKSRQTSSICPWFAFDLCLRGSYYYYPDRNSSPNLNELFADDKMVAHNLTADFCPWSALDGKGMDALFDDLFIEDSQNKGEFTRVSDKECDSEIKNHGIGRLLDPRSSDHEEIIMDPGNSPDAVAHRRFFNQVERFFSGITTSLREKQGDPVNEMDDKSQLTSSSVSSKTYIDTDLLCTPGRECPDYLFRSRRLSKPIDAGLAPLREWIPRLTRWPFRFAPQQSIELSMTGIKVPPWRATSGRMMSDVCQFCAKNRDISNLVLLDPMALSPLSPLLNLMRYQALPRPRLTGVLWMTPLDALSPSYHVPVPLTEQQNDSDDEVQEGGDEGVYPTPTCLRFLTITAYLTNWVAWMSRMESYSVLGMSRFNPMLISAAVAAHTLQPLSLGCGQAPLLDLWPLWLLRRLLTLSLKLSHLHIPFLHCNNRHLRYLFPFSDLDEI